MFPSRRAAIASIDEWDGHTTTVGTDTSICHPSAGQARWV